MKILYNYLGVLIALEFAVRPPITTIKEIRKKQANKYHNELDNMYRIFEEVGLNEKCTK